MAEREEAELRRKFSNSRSKEVARFLKEVARARISWRSAPAESRTSRHPRERKEIAFSAVADDVVGGDGSVTGFSIVGGVLEVQLVMELGLGIGVSPSCWWWGWYYRRSPEMEFAKRETTGKKR